MYMCTGNAESRAQVEKLQTTVVLIIQHRHCKEFMKSTKLVFSIRTFDRVDHSVQCKVAMSVTSE